jgi:hypothetical protein
MATPVNQSPVLQSPFNKQRKDKFILSLNPPKILKPLIANVEERDSGKVNFNSLQMSVYGAIVPTLTIPALSIPYGGVSQKISSMHRPDYPVLKINFTVDNQFNNYWFLYKWMQILNDNKTGTAATQLTLEDYGTDISIFGLDEYNVRVIKFDYTGAFPVSLAGIEYSDRDASEMISSFEFGYSRFIASLQ